ncbi:MAG: Hsp20/alpha crystallin family protein [Candidatus Gracilibacteria bacterium]|nr:Hsp20/alpha crystallin family protein [Candidatus Gracilibacteria bacterium]MDD3119846.1 Hsp20/alpha crystallin family protein [Candidatus Gracilibacteria bacterium]MDD4531071.1 Hsp20/alpha crystallin family protein [Candidatus Gracilibacteria bacterium]
MFKIFNLGGDKDNDGISDEINIDIDESGSYDGVEDVGQVAVDILEMEDNLVVVAPLAGMDIEDINIAISKNILTISGERIQPNFYNEASKILVEECFFGLFSRSIILPENLALNKIKASLDNNMLVIEIPKLNFESKTIKINKLEG